MSRHFGDYQHCLLRLETLYQFLQPAPVKAATPRADLADASRLQSRDFSLNPPKRQPKVYEIPDSAELTTCECGAEVYFVPTPSGTTMPVTSDKVSHFETCPDAKKYSGRSKAKAGPPVLPDPKIHKLPE